MSKSKCRCKIFIGNLIHCTNLFKIEVLENSFIVVQDNKIIEVNNIDELEKVKQKLDTSWEEVKLTKSQLLIPGLIDTHIHAPQYPNAGLGYDKQLLDWLQTYTFPLEKKFSDLEFAEKVYRGVVRKTLDHGTTTASYFATLHVEATEKLADICIEIGQRAFIGKVNMVNFCPDDFKETNESSIQDTEKIINTILNKKSDLIQPIITPRFALSCDEQLMKKLAEIAKKYDLNIQSHISENQSEVDTVKNLFHKNYAQVYDDCNLLTDKTIMAHGVYLLNDEMKLLSDRGTSVSHCPGSNCSLQSGNCNVRGLIQAGIKVGLGTDVSGGPSPSIIESMRRAMDVSIQQCFRDCTKTVLNYKEVFYLATLGGAKALAIDKKVGNFIPGKEFDALVIDMDVPNSNVDYIQDLSVFELLQKFIYTGDDRNVLRTYVAGRQVK